MTLISLFFRLPNDVYQMAKVSKVLRMAEKGNLAQFKNKSLDEIQLNDDDSVMEDSSSDEDKEAGGNITKVLNESNH